MSTVAQSFGRVVTVKIFAIASALPSAANLGFTIDYSSGFTKFSSVQADGSPGFRIRGKVFKMESANVYNPNPATIYIYNLGASSRALFESQLLTNVIVEAGYGSGAKQIIKGQTVWARTIKHGPDFITELHIQTGIFATVNATINQVFKGQVSYQTIADACYAALDNFGIGQGTVIDMPVGFYNMGRTLTGNPFDRLKELCDKVEYYCSIQDDLLSVRPYGTPLEIPPVYLDENTGLIGIPEFRAQSLLGAITPDVLATPTNGLSFKCLIRPEIGVGSQVKIKSKFVNGIYTPLKVVHDFDSWEGPFFTDCECTV